MMRFKTAIGELKSGLRKVMPGCTESVIINHPIHRCLCAFPYACCISIEIFELKKNLQGEANLSLYSSAYEGTTT